MPTVRLASTQPVAARDDIDRERAALSRALAVRWPRAARDVLLIAGRVDRFNRRCRALGLPQLAAVEPVVAASAMWAAMGMSDATVPVRPARFGDIGDGRAGGHGAPHHAGPPGEVKGSAGLKGPAPL